MGKRNIYIAIMVAAAKGNGLRLTAEEVLSLKDDDAISTHAANSLSEAEFKSFDDWEKIDPRAERVAFNGATGDA